MKHVRKKYPLWPVLIRQAALRLWSWLSPRKSFWSSCKKQRQRTDHWSASLTFPSARCSSCCTLQMQQVPQVSYFHASRKYRPGSSLQPATLFPRTGNTDNILPAPLTGLYSSHSNVCYVTKIFQSQIFPWQMPLRYAHLQDFPPQPWSAPHFPHWYPRKFYPVSAPWWSRSRRRRSSSQAVSAPVSSSDGTYSRAPCSHGWRPRSSTCRHIPSHSRSCRHHPWLSPSALRYSYYQNNSSTTSECAGTDPYGSVHRSLNLRHQMKILCSIQRCIVRLRLQRFPPKDQWAVPFFRR